MPTDHEKAYVRYLEGLRERQDRGPMASLRRGLGKAAWEAPETYPYIVPWLPADGGPWRESCYFLVAPLYAVHGISWRPQEAQRGRTNLGASLARLAESGMTSAEQRLVVLLNSRREDLPERLRSAIGLLASSQVPIDWAQLLHDTVHWGAANRWVQREWARAFWSSVPGQSQAMKEER